MQIITQYFRLFVVSVIKISPVLKTDFECSPSKVEICHICQQDFASEKQLTSYFVFFFYIYRIMSNSLELNSTFCVPHCREESRTLKDFFIIKFHQKLRQISSLEMLRFFFFSVYFSKSYTVIFKCGTTCVE